MVSVLVALKKVFTAEHGTALDPLALEVASDESDNTFLFEVWDREYGYASVWLFRDEVRELRDALDGVLDASPEQSERDLKQLEFEF